MEQRERERVRKTEKEWGEGETNNNNNSWPWSTKTWQTRKHKDSWEMRKTAIDQSTEMCRSNYFLNTCLGSKQHMTGWSVIWIFWVFVIGDKMLCYDIMQRCQLSSVYSLWHFFCFKRQRSESPQGSGWSGELSEAKWRLNGFIWKPQTSFWRFEKFWLAVRNVRNVPVFWLQITWLLLQLIYDAGRCDWFQTNQITWPLWSNQICLTQSDYK